MRPFARLATVLFAVAAIAVPAAIPAQAASDLPAPTLRLAGKPVWGTLQNLPGMGATAMTWAGPTLAPQIDAYYTGGRWQADVARSAAHAKSLLRSLLKSECGGDPKSCDAMVVFDIDETLLNNYGYWSTTTPAFTFDGDAFSTWSESCGQSAIGPTVKFYKLAQKWGVHVALITGRSETLRQATATCLKKRGITGWDTLILKGVNDTRDAARYKADARGVLERRGNTILISVGDQLSDMAHGHEMAGIWLPNPMYFIP